MCSSSHDILTGVCARAGLVYHAYYRPLTTSLATLLDLSATMHSLIPSGLPSPATFLRSVGSAFPGSSLTSIANAMTTRPIHVDHVAEAICLSLRDPSIQGVVDVRKMRDLI